VLVGLGIWHAARTPEEQQLLARKATPAPEPTPAA